MSRAETFRVIEVRSDESLTRTAVGHRDPVEPVRPSRDRLAVWAPANGAVSALHPSPIPTLEVDRIRLPAVLDDRLVLLSDPRGSAARGYRLLRHALLSAGDPRIVSVTSATKGEGKTTLAINLALAIAEDTMLRVLLLEANLRRPVVGRIFGFEPAESLVANMTRFTDVGPPYPVAAIEGTRVHVAALPASPLVDARLDRTLLAVALTDLRSSYDYVVIDTASILESADADVVGECSNGVVLATRAGLSRRTELQRALRQIAPAPVLGTALIDA